MPLVSPVGQASEHTCLLALTFLAQPAPAFPFYLPLHTPSSRKFSLTSPPLLTESLLLPLFPGDTVEDCSPVYLSVSPTGPRGLAAQSKGLDFR